MLSPFPVLLLGWLVTGAGALVGSILGNGFGERGLFAGAVLGGLAGVALATGVSRRLGWLPAGLGPGALIGGIVGFGMAVPITLGNMDTPLIPVVSCALVGVGMLVGAGVARGARGPS